MRTERIADVPFKVPAGLDYRHGEFQEAVAKALRIVETFAAKHSWKKQARIRTFDAVELFSTQEGLWKRILELNKLPVDTKIPTGGLVAAIESRVLVAVIPEECRRINPDYTAGKNGWTRVLAHEMVHRLHVEVLGGNEDAMGPVWFFEGFAMAGAGQDYIGSEIRFASVDTALSTVSEVGAHTRGSYKTYAAAVRFFMEKLPLQEMVNMAGRPGFEGWLRSSTERR